MKPTLRTVAIATAGLLAVTVLAGCSSSPTEGDAGGTVTIAIGNRPVSSDADNRAYYDKQVKAFEKANPTIKLKPSETIYDASTFQALVAGGNLPDVLNVPFTEPQGLIARKQIADLTDALTKSGLDKDLNPTVLKVAQDSAGKTYGVPIGAYSVGLIYNRDLFAKAGLDPNKPPTTWDEVRADAKQITEKTGAAGYAQLSNKNQGGWMFTAQTYSFGGSIENAAGTKVTFNDTAAKNALQAVHDMRWTDGSMPSTALFDLDSMAQQFAAGKVGMWMGAPDQYRASIVTNGMDPKNFAVGGLPQSGGEHGTLAGGSMEVVNPAATEQEKAAAIKWIEFFYLDPLVNKDAAVSQAKAQAADKQPVGVPGLPVTSADQLAKYNEWIKPYVNVPLDNFAPYVKVAADQAIIPEPTAQAQEVYAALDPVVQAVLSDQNANISSLLTNAASTVQAKLGR